MHPDQHQKLLIESRCDLAQTLLPKLLGVPFFSHLSKPNDLEALLSRGVRSRTFHGDQNNGETTNEMDPERNVNTFALS